MPDVQAAHDPSTPNAAPNPGDPSAAPIFTWDQIATQLTSGWLGACSTFALTATRTLTYNVSGLSTAERAIAVAALEA